MKINNNDYEFYLLTTNNNVGCSGSLVSNGKKFVGIVHGFSNIT